MLSNLLDTTVDQNIDQYISKGTAALYALVGFIVVFIGIAFLIFVVWAVGKIMSSKNGVQPKKEQPVKKVETVQQKTTVAASDEISEETLAVITAALMAYYQTNKPKCEFTVKRIKRI